MGLSTPKAHATAPMQKALLHITQEGLFTWRLEKASAQTTHLQAHQHHAQHLQGQQQHQR